MCAACGLEFKWMLPIPIGIQKFVVYCILFCIVFYFFAPHIYRMQARRLHYINCNVRYYNTIFEIHVI